VYLTATQEDDLPTDSSHEVSCPTVEEDTRRSEEVEVKRQEKVEVKEEAEEVEASPSPFRPEGLIGKIDFLLLISLMIRTL
jgi:Na+-transporting NADH:ubiquinone oxidoreductase subunit NqrF